MGHAARLLVTALLLLLSGSSLAASAQCELKPGVKLGADKVGDKNGTSSATAAACCTLCQANTKCIVFAWDKDKHICDIFKKLGDSKTKAHYVSGLAHAAPPGPPVPPTPPSPPPAVYPNVKPCDKTPLKGSPACDPDTPLEQRVEAIVRMLPEAELYAMFSDKSAGSPTLNIPYYDWWSEALLAIDETVILLHPPLPLAGVSIVMERERQQIDSLVNG